MKTKIRNLSIYTITTLLILGGVAIADKLIPEGDTSTPTMYTLTDIYNKLTAGTEASTHDISTTSLPTESMNTLQEIYDSIPAYITLDGSTTTLPFGIYATTTLDSIDTDLTGANIVEGATIFGVEGSAPTGGGAPALTWSADHPDGYVNWATAQAYCTGLGGGYRLPYVEELVQESPIANPTFTKVGGFQSDDYWSGVTYPYISDLAYYVSMDSGDVSSYDKADPSNLARCVR